MFLSPFFLDLFNDSDVCVFQVMVNQSTLSLSKTLSINIDFYIKKKDLLDSIFTDVDFNNQVNACTDHHLSQLLPLKY